jgi:hypothetical protein
VSVLLNAGDGSFATEVRYEAGFEPTSVVLDDVDGDDVTDIVAVRPDDATNRYALHVLAGAGDGTFAPDASPQLVDLPTNGGVGWAMLAAGDVDGDGDVDLAMGAGGAFNNAVLRNDGAGQFAPTLHDVFGLLRPQLVDLDDDGDLDLVGVGGGGGTTGAAWVQRNAGDGTFGTPEEIRTSRNPLGLDVTDLNGDGRLDLAIANRDTGSGATHLQREDGTFASPPTGDRFAPAVDAAAADLDGDGDTDVAATGTDAFEEVVRILANDGSGELTQTGTVRWEDPANSNGRSVQTGDIDSDGDVDLAWVVSSGEPSRVLTARNDGSGAFAAPTALELPTCADEVTLADADGDGDPDLVLGNSGGCGSFSDSNKVTVALNDGTGQFPAQTLVPLAASTIDVAITDIDADGLLDLVGVSASSAPNDVALALAAAPGQFTAPTYLTTGLAHREVVAVDLEGDGDVDVASSGGDGGTAVLLNDGTGALSSTVLAGEVIPGYRNAVGLAAGDVNGDTKSSTSSCRTRPARTSACTPGSVTGRSRLRRCGSGRARR